jgi:hypothetical protein
MDIQTQIVELIARNDSSWTWYQLDRGLAERGFNPSPDLLSLVSDLLKEGLIEERSDSRYPQPLYSVTTKGKAFLLAKGR